MPDNLCHHKLLKIVVYSLYWDQTHLKVNKYAKGIPPIWATNTPTRMQPGIHHTSTFAKPKLKLRSTLIGILHQPWHHNPLQHFRKHRKKADARYERGYAFSLSRDFRCTTKRALFQASGKQSSAKHFPKTNSKYAMAGIGFQMLLHISSVISSKSGDFLLLTWQILSAISDLSKTRGPYIFLMRGEWSASSALGKKTLNSPAVHSSQQFLIANLKARWVNSPTPNRTQLLQSSSLT